MDLETKIKEFEKKWEHKEKFEEAWERRSEFLKLFPFREHPESIDKLTAEQIYNPRGDKDYFFNWIEHKLKGLGHLSIGSARVWENARENVNTLKQLLKIIVDDSVSIADKIDAHWEDIKGFGGDRHIAKKILYCYYPEKVLSTYKTEDLEDFSDSFDLRYREKAYEKYGKDYDLLSVGQKFEFLNELLLLFKNQHSKMKNWSNGEFGGLLYQCYPPSRITEDRSGIKSSKRILKPFSPYGLTSEPKYEQEVVFLFSKFHIQLGFPLITKIAPAFPDAEALDKDGKHRKIEFEVLSSDFINHSHDPKACDFIICWEDDLSEEQKQRKSLPKVISLKEELSQQ